MGKRKKRNASNADATAVEEQQAADVSIDAQANGDETLSDEEFDRYLEHQKAHQSAPAAPPQMPPRPPQQPTVPHQAVNRPATPAAQATTISPPPTAAPPMMVNHPPTMQPPPVARQYATPPPAAAPPAPAATPPPAAAPPAPAATPPPAAMPPAAAPPAPAQAAPVRGPQPATIRAPGAPPRRAPAPPQAPPQAAPLARAQPRQLDLPALSQPQSPLMTIDNAEYAILSPGQNTSLAMEYAQDSMFDLNAWDLPRIKWPTQGNTLWQFMTASGPVSAEYITGILVFFKEGYDFWAHKFGDEESGPPQCTSNDGRIGIGDPGGQCHFCPWFQWGSRRQIDPSNPDSNAKACRHTTRMFIIQHGSVMPTLIVAPPTSVKSLRRYALECAGKSLFYFGVETHFGLAPKQSGKYTIAELNCMQSRILNDAQLHEAHKMMATFKTMYEGVRATQEEAGTL